MKKYHVSLLLLLFISINVIAQDNVPNDLKDINNKKHEIRIDVIEALLVPAIDISYEHVLNKYSGFGLSINIAFEEENDFNSSQDFSITPYYRQYFFNKKDYGARGFFAEGVFQFAGGEAIVFDFNEINGADAISRNNWTQFGVGFSIGQKWVSSNGFVLELLAGGGRYISNDEIAPGGFFRGGLNIGYRF